MSPTDRLRAILVVGCGLTGLALLAGRLSPWQRPNLAGRVVPYLRSPRPGADGPTRILAGLVADLGVRLHRLLGGGADLEVRLRRAGLATSATAFRAEQVTWGLAGLAAGLAAAVALGARPGALPPAGVLGLAVTGAVGGVVLRDRRLTRHVQRRRAAAEAGFPTFVDLVCIAVTAGESLREALEVAAGTVGGPIADHVTAALTDTRTGERLGEALARHAERSGVPVFRRFVASVLAAQERGIPLADALAAMAFDVREAGRREVLEAAGRKEVTMLVPVVCLILPVAIVFAFFPGVIAVRTLVR